MGYDDRRIEIAKAAWQVTVREGLERTSMRAIAQELGSSTGVVTHYFRNKEDLTLFALEQVFENTLEHMEACAHGLKGISSLEQMIFSVLPLETSDIDDWKVWIAFLGYSVGRDHLVQAHRKRYELIHKILSKELTDLKTAGLLQTDLDVSLEANALIALVDGIGAGVVINPKQFSVEQQKYIVKQHINALQTQS